MAEGICRVCRCTEHDCRQCIRKTGLPCTWVNEDEDLCSACVGKFVQRLEKLLDEWLTLEVAREISGVPARKVASLERRSRKALGV